MPTDKKKGGPSAGDVEAIKVRMYSGCVTGESQVGADSGVLVLSLVEPIFP